MSRLVVRVLPYLVSLLLIINLQGCGGTKHHMRVYKDAPSIHQQQKNPIDYPLSTGGIFSGAYDRYIPEALSGMGYPLTFTRGIDNRLNVMMGSTIWPYKYDNWNINLKHLPAKALKSIVGGIRNETLTQQDVTIFEIKIVGLSNHKVTTASKRFEGPVKPFRWVDLFKDQVREDKQGYLMQVTVSVNYLKNLGFDKSKNTFVHIPANFQRRTQTIRSTSAKGHYFDFSVNLIGSTKDSPFQENKWVKENKWEDFYTKRVKVLKGKRYKNFLYMNPLFLSHHGMLAKMRLIRRKNGSYSFLRSNRREARLKKAAIYKAYKNEQHFEDRLHSLSNLVPSMAILAGMCRNLAYNAKLDSTLTYHSKSRKQQVVKEYSNRYGYVTWVLDETQRLLAVTSQELVSHSRQPGGIGVRPLTLARLKHDMAGLAKFLPYPKKKCAEAGVHVRSVSRAGIRDSGPGFLSLLGNAMAKELRSSSSSRYSSSTGTSSGNNSVAQTWKQFHVNLNATFNALQQQEQAMTAQRKRAYYSSLNQLKNERLQKQQQHSRTTASSRSSSPQVNTTAVQNASKRKGSAKASTAISKRSSSASYFNVVTPRTNKQPSVRDSSAAGNAGNKSKKECVAHTESGNPLPSGICGLVYADYSRTLHFNYDDFKVGGYLEGSTKKQDARQYLHNTMKEKALKMCKKEGYDRLYHPSDYQLNNIESTVKECKEIKKGSNIAYLCRGSSEFTCARRAN